MVMHSLLDPDSPVNPYTYNSFPQGILPQALSLMIIVISFPF